MTALHFVNWKQHMKAFLRATYLSSLILATGVAQAEWSANAGFASEYYYRGFFQKESSASAGIDYENNGFYAGTWAADVGDGLEVDGYLGYGADVGDVSLSVGFTGYYYTGDFDDTYQEINLGAAFNIFSLDVAVGEYDNFDGPTQDYTFYSLTAEKNGFYGKYAGFSQDAEGSYFEFGYGTTVAEIDLGVSLIFADEDIAGESDEAIVFTIGKSFDL
jgi:uncharacterized protein (TIGR02001 family)